MSKYLLGVATILTAGSVMAGTPSSLNSLGNVPQLTYTLVSGGDDGGAGRDSGSDRGGRGSEAGDDRGGGREAEAGDDRGGGREAEFGDDRGGGGEMEVGDDKGVDVYDQPDDSDVLLIPSARSSK